MLEVVKDKARAAVTKLDGFLNELAGLGVEGKDRRLETTTNRHVPRSEYEIDDLYQGAWYAARIVDELPEDAVRRWIDLTIDGDDGAEIAEEVLDQLDAWEVREKFAEAMKLARRHGGAVVMLKTKDTQSLENELPEGAEIESLEVYSRHRFERPKIETDPKSPDFGKVRYFRLAGVSEVTGRNIHPSRLILFKGKKVGDDHPLPNARIDPDVHFWGQSQVDLCWDALRKFGTAWDSFEATFLALNQDVITVEGLKTMAAETQRDTLIAYLRQIQISKSVLNAVVVDSNDSVDTKSVSVTGFGEAVIRAGENLAGAAHMPLTKLFGAPPTGLSTDDASGERNWGQYVASVQRTTLRRPIDRMVAHALATKGRSGAKARARFLPLAEETDEQISIRRERDANTATRYWDLEAISSDETREALRADPHNPIPLSEIEDKRREAERKAAEQSEASPESADRTNVSAVTEILSQAAAGKIPRETAVLVLINFYGLSAEAAEAMVSNIGAGFEPKKEEPPPAAPGQPIAPEPEAP